MKGTGGDRKRILKAIACGTGINLGLILLITLITLVGVGSGITQDGALVDLAGHLGGWVGTIGYIFSLLALSTSFWANALNLRDILHEQTGIKERPAALVAILPSLLLALIGMESFVTFTRLAGIIQVMTGIGIILAYAKARKRAGTSPIMGKWGTLPFRLLVVLGSVMATVGSVLPVK